MNGGAVRLFHTLAETKAQHELALGHVHVLFIIARLCLHGIHADLGADVVIDLASWHPGQCVAQGLLHVLKLCLTTVKQFHRAFAQKLTVIAAEFLVVDGLAFGDVAETGNGVIFKTAHLLETALHGVAALFIDPAANEIQ